MNHEFKVGDIVFLVEDTSTKEEYGASEAVTAYLQDSTLLEVVSIDKHSVHCRPMASSAGRVCLHPDDLELVQEASERIAAKQTIETQMADRLERQHGRLRPTLFCKANPNNPPVEIHDDMYIEFNELAQEIQFHIPLVSAITWTFNSPLHYEATKQKLIDRFYEVI